MNGAAPADLQRLSEEVARDPESLAFLPLARAYRRQGKREAALKLCLRGLAHHPANVEAHALLARLYLEGGERQKAADEWAVMLRLDPDNFEAHRGMGFYRLEQGDHAAAREHLEQAAAARPDDPTVREAMELLGEREAADAARPAASGPARARAVSVADPGEVFEPLRGDGPFRGAVLVDRSGLVLAGTLDGGDGTGADALGAALGEVIEEVVRAVDYLELGTWQHVLLDAEGAAVYLGPVDEDHLIVFAAEPDTPAGWMIRGAARATELAGEFLEQGV